MVERDRRSTVVEGDVDESQVSVRFFNGQSQPAALDAAAINAVRTEIASLHRREPSDDALVAALPGAGAPGVGTSAATCIER